MPEEQVKLTPENIEWGIEEALGHYAEDWIRRNVREMLRVGKRDEAIKFLSEHIRNFGVASPGQPYAHGTPKGLLIQSAIMDPKETKLITWAELLRHIEMEEVKTLEEYGVIPEVIPKVIPMGDEAKTLLRERVGYRCTEFRGSGVTKATDVIRFEVDELSNEHILNELREVLGLPRSATLEQSLSAVRDRFGEDSKAIWLGTKEAVKELYCGEEEEPIAVDIPENAVLISNLGYDGQLFLFPGKGTTPGAKPIVDEEPVEEPKPNGATVETYKTAGRVTYPVKLEVTTRTGGVGPFNYNVDTYYNDELIQSSSQSTIPEVEEYLKLGESELNMYEARLSVGDPEVVLASLYRWFGVYPELAEVYKKVDEGRWDEITDDEKRKVEEAWGDAWSKEWVLTWTPADAVWSSSAQKEREIYYHKYTYDSLMAMKADELREIARIKGVRTGRKEEMARAIHQLDYGEEEAKSKMAEIDKLLG